MPDRSPSPLNKMIPLAVVLRGGGGGAWGAIGDRGLLYSHANCTYNNHNYKLYYK